MGNCSRCTGDFIEDYLLNRLSSDDADSFEVHLLICGQCRSAVEEQQDFCEALKGAFYGQMSITANGPPVLQTA